MIGPKLFILLSAIVLPYTQSRPNLSKRSKASSWATEMSELKENALILEDQTRKFKSKYNSICRCAKLSLSLNLAESIPDDSVKNAIPTAFKKLNQFSGLLVYMQREETDTYRKKQLAGISLQLNNTYNSVVEIMKGHSMKIHATHTGTAKTIKEKDEKISKHLNKHGWTSIPVIETRNYFILNELESQANNIAYAIGKLPTLHRSKKQS